MPVRLKPLTAAASTFLGNFGRNEWSQRPRNTKNASRNVTLHDLERRESRRPPRPVGRREVDTTRFNWRPHRACVCVSLVLLLLLLELCGVVVVVRAKEGGIVTPHGGYLPHTLRFLCHCFFSSFLIFY
ncbi:hypothetical protein TcCL_NonESM10045 [Trypanosoma cruzi]|nr:hypothetical protein TcCL_NonESM10045 [Trypanosoma cruzi]